MPIALAALSLSDGGPGSEPIALLFEHGIDAIAAKLSDALGGGDDGS